MGFINREATNITRKKLKIISQTPEYIIADVERADNASVLGTAVDATTFNNWNEQITATLEPMNQALSEFAEFKSEFTTIQSNSLAAVENSTQAKQKAENAIALANDAKDAVAAEMGTSVQVAGVAEPLVVFDSNPQEQISSKLNKNYNALTLKSEISNADLFAIQNSDSVMNVKENAKTSWQNIKQNLVNDETFVDSFVAKTTLLSNINSINTTLEQIPNGYIAKNSDGGFNLNGWKISVNGSGNIVFEKLI